MPKYDLKRSTQIDAPIETARALITDFRRWPDWSPWTVQEPECQLAYFGDTAAVGSGYSWNGERIGSGKITLVDSTDGRLDCDLQFVKPFKSQADVRFEFESLGESRCKVTWHMHSSMPFFLFFMIPNIKRYVGMDYERGLRMLKELAETGSVASRVDFKGEQMLPELTYLGVEVELKMSDIPAAMETHYTAMAALIDAEKLGIAGQPFCDYRLADLKNDRHQMLIGIPIEDTPRREVATYQVGTRAAFHCARFDHTGAYEHLGNSWATAMGWVRHHKRKPHKASVGIEIYVNDPAHTPRQELLTELYIPLRG